MTGNFHPIISVSHGLYGREQCLTGAPCQTLQYLVVALTLRPSYSKMWGCITWSLLLIIPKSPKLTQCEFGGHYSEYSYVVHTDPPVIPPVHTLVLLNSSYWRNIRIWWVYSGAYKHFDLITYIPWILLGMKCCFLIIYRSGTQCSEPAGWTIYEVWLLRMFFSFVYRWQVSARNFQLVCNLQHTIF